jgi:hypothetical protein
LDARKAVSAGEGDKTQHFRPPLVTFYTQTARNITNIFVPLQLNILPHNVMMQLVSINGTVLLEREKPSTKRANNSTLHVRRMSKGMKKTVTPRLMSREVRLFIGMHHYYISYQ